MTNFFMFVGQFLTLALGVGFVAWTIVSNIQANKAESYPMWRDYFKDEIERLQKKIERLDSDENKLWDELQNKQDRKRK